MLPSGICQSLSALASGNRPRDSPQPRGRCRSPCIPARIRRGLAQRKSGINLRHHGTHPKSRRNPQRVSAPAFRHPIVESGTRQAICRKQRHDNPPCVITTALVVPVRSKPSTICSNAVHTRCIKAAPSSPPGGERCSPLPCIHAETGGSSFCSSSAVLPSHSPKSVSRSPSTSTGFASG